MAAAGACGWDHLDALGPAGADAPPIGDAWSGVEPSATDGAPEASWDADASEMAVDDGGAEAFVAEDGAASDSSASEAAGPSDASPPDAAASVRPCTGSPSVVREWTFDSDVQGWTLALNPGVQGGVVWTGSTGNPSPGALEVDVTSVSPDGGTANGAWARYNATPVGDLSGRTISAWVWLDRGPSPRFKVFVQTGAQYSWADDGVVPPLSPRTWTCVEMAVSNPSYNQPDYDPTSVVVIGFEMLGSAPFRVFLDTVRYY